MDTSGTIQADPDTRSHMAILDPTGDTKVFWDKDNPDEVANARRTFNDLRAKGFLAYKLSGRGDSKGEVLHEFDARAERIILTPAHQGG